ncbi:heterokaryon incompatibility protein-domain-containing protein [Neurospora tetraspora]|uniref:Heterokaryon incompatibility protein-domain-containing protein n=1 Tax=Neurospora tetraspora TaxID=94610 RepID=A0AAE0JN69_9PEZI|nr:heterokaryon incompatibility protein-domain-containing protein [Neurospora tetraspora]
MEFMLSGYDSASVGAADDDNDNLLEVRALGRPFTGFAHSLGRSITGTPFQTLDPAEDEIIGDTSINRPRSLFSGRERPVIIDPDLPRRWLRSCLEDHKDICPLNRRQNRTASTFRLIDTSTKAVVEFRGHRLGDIQYVALSCIWGNGHKITPRHDTVTQLQLTGSLPVAGPQTVLDAIKFTSDMGIRYLWVDAFCIIQDDENDKAAQLQLMAEIYQYALFTIVAAAGNNAQAGLPGISIPREAVQQKVLVKKAESPELAPIWLISTLAPRDKMREYAWSTRGWTLQEKVLSRRVLTFTDKRLLWRCRQCKKWEEIDTETASDLSCSLRYEGTGGRSLDLDPFMEPNPSRIGQAEITASPWQNLSSLISEFARRDLIVQGDAHDAASAILREYTIQTGVQFLWGLPADARFELALCWHYTTKPSELDPHAGKPLRRRQEYTTLPTTSLQQRRSRAGRGWGGEGRLICRIWIIPKCWFHQADSQNTRPEDIETPIVAYVLKNTPLELVRTSTLTPEADTHAPTSHKQNDDPDASLVTLDMIVTELPDLTFDRLSLIPDDQILFFWAETAHFFLSPLSKSNHSSDRGRPIYDEKGEYCGDVGPLPGAVGAVDDDADEEDDFGRDSSSARDAKGTSTSTSNNNQRAEFIALRRFTYICLVLQVERREGIVYRRPNSVICSPLLFMLHTRLFHLGVWIESMNKRHSKLLDAAPGGMQCE